MVKLLGDFYRVLGIAEQPIVEKTSAPNALYYWFEVFRRASILNSPSNTPCWYILLDVYTRNCERIEMLAEECANAARIGGKSGDTIATRICKIHRGVAHVIEPSMLDVWIELNIYENGCEVISMHAMLCGYAEPPSYDDILNLYSALIALVERRDIRSEPLWVDVREIMVHKPA